MNDQNEWKWYSGSDQEAFTDGPFDTREQAIAELDGHGGYVIMARKFPLRLSKYFDAAGFLEDAEEAVYDLCNEDGDPIFDISNNQHADLEARVRATIEAWQDESGLTFIPWGFSGVKGLERIQGDEA